MCNILFYCTVFSWYLTASGKIWPHVKCHKCQCCNLMPYMLMNFYINLECVLCEHIFHIKFISTTWEIALGWMSDITFDDKSILIKVWCHHATSHYYYQCWPRPMDPYDVQMFGSCITQACAFERKFIPVVSFHCLSILHKGWLWSIHNGHSFVDK